jgi:hypothetical protein
MKRLPLIVFWLALLGQIAWAADAFVLHDLPLGSSLKQAQKRIAGLKKAEAPEGLTVWVAAGIPEKSSDFRLVFNGDKLVSISFKTAPGSIEQARRALQDILGPFTPDEEGHFAYEARAGSRRLQLLKQDDGSAWVVLIDVDALKGHQER